MFQGGQRPVVEVLGAEDDRPAGVVGAPLGGHGKGLGILCVRRPIVRQLGQVARLKVAQGNRLVAERDLALRPDRVGRRRAVSLVLHLDGPLRDPLNHAALSQHSVRVDPRRRHVVCDGDLVAGLQIGQLQTAAPGPSPAR